jgi:flagellin-specific chaperone FliS
MQKEFEILDNLSEEQRAEFKKDMQELYTFCKNQPGFPMGSKNEATVNMNLLNEVFLKVTFDFEDAESDKVKGRILKLYKYENEQEYREAVAEEVNS